MVNIGKALDAAKYTILLVVLLWLISQVLLIVLPADLSIIRTALEVGLIGINILLFIWSGYRATKKLQQDLWTAGLAGFLAALIAGILTFILGIVLTVVQIALKAQGADISEALIASGFDFGSAAMAAAIFIPLSIVANFVLAFIGGFIGEKM